MSARTSTRPSHLRSLSIKFPMVADAETGLLSFQLSAAFPAGLEERVRVCPDTVEAPWLSARY
jgi:hypothetical protein